MKKLKLLFLPLLAVSLCSCGPEDIPEGGNIDDLIPAEFDFSNFSRQAVFEGLDALQHNSGYSITFKLTHYDDLNAEPTFVSDVTIGGKGGYNWAYETTNGETYGAAVNIESTNYTAYILKDGVWSIEDGGEYTVDDCVEYIDEKVDEVVIREEYLSKVDFSSSKQSTTVCSRSCYVFVYDQDYYLTIALDKVLGIMMSFSVTYVDTVESKIYRDRVEVQSFSVSNIELPAFPSK